MKKSLQEGLKNIVFLIGGLAMVLYAGPEIAMAPAGAMALLMIGSGWHHWNLLAEKISKDITRLADFAGMYAVCFSIFIVATGFDGWAATGIMTGSTIVWTIIAKSNRIALGALFALVLAILIWHAPLYEVLNVVGWLAVSVYVNYVGDNINEEHHHFIHGIIWHTLISITAVKAFVLLIQNL